jgi:threonine dehydrogenase-like Zn-dependent dehydrogenase
MYFSAARFPSRVDEHGDLLRLEERVMDPTGTRAMHQWLRNAVASDFPRILAMIQSGQINTRPWISHRCEFGELPEQMEAWLLPQSRVIKAVVALAQ